MQYMNDSKQNTDILVVIPMRCKQGLEIIIYVYCHFELYSSSRAMLYKQWIEI